jgi:hypothetical protein
MQADGQGAIEKVFYKVTWGTTRFGDDTEEIFIKMVDTWAA